MSMFEPAECAKIALGGWKLEDLCFLDDEELLFGLSARGEKEATWSALGRVDICHCLEASILIGFNYRQMSFQRNDANHGSIEIDSRAPCIDLVEDNTIRAHTRIEFPKGVSWTPRRLVVSGNMGSTRAACILAKDLFTYRIYDLGTSRAGQS